MLCKNMYLLLQFLIFCYVIVGINLVDLYLCFGLQSTSIAGIRIVTAGFR